MNKRFLFTVLSLIVIVVIAGGAIFLAKGYRYQPDTGTFSGTGIISVSSIPDQASVYLDGHLTTATDDNITSLPPKTYKVRIVKEGYIPWEKDIEVTQGLVSEIKATLFRSIPTIYPITYSGVDLAVLSPDNLKLMYIIPNGLEGGAVAEKKSGIWVWVMDNPGGIGLGGGEVQRQLVQSNGVDYSKASYRWSPDSTQIFVDLPERKLLLDINRLNDIPRDITANYQATLKSWDETENKNKLTKLEQITDLTLRKTASNSALLKWSPDETKVLYKSSDGNYKLNDLSFKRNFDLPKASSYEFLPDSKHLVMLEVAEASPKPNPSGSPVPSTIKDQFTPVRISIIEIDGTNKAEIYFGSIAPEIVVPWPDGSRLVVISSLPTQTASEPNLYGINLK
ncbi:PEGA domain-containing protein [Candidatus Daviesbacteria bacterium]|nr:PEGA domain-containing protein [Candidatus Daviesbacteria bacterium]